MRTMRPLLAGIAVATLFSASGAHAATAVCTTTVSYLANHAPGGVFVQLTGYNIWKVCDLDAQFFRTTPANCRHIFAMLSVAFTQDKTVQVYVDNAPSTDCSSIGSWFDADVRYVRVDR